ncbi:hypothetical protein A1O1_01615 [Capronia coronata CBS 617.96]|uniref:Uncharacterized protein n=1 Tax=Capronia coronata CBS 617.96 TaxID=1182541 RepID=W9ZPU0_9EURO|nr:uncharacterized protein A1O1_01615 [Capronia coronata CBS 617.96]EXJ96489.1 hypothetical protein A1O1_01615 [Capronia coronata CBS 617.96]
MASLWSMWGGDMFPAEKDPKGGMFLPSDVLLSIALFQPSHWSCGSDPNYWTESELRRWLKSRNLEPDSKMTRAELLERVKANLRPDSSA